MISIAEKSAAHNRHGNVALLEDDVHHVLDLLCGARGCLVKGRADHQTIGFGVGVQSTRLKGTRADSSGVCGVKTQRPTDRLTDTHDVHRTHKHNRFQSRNIDAFCQNAVMKNHKLLVGILTPVIQSVKEHLTIHLLPVNKGTVLGSNVHHRITLFCQLFGKVRFRQKLNDILGSLGTNQDFIHGIFLNDLEKILTVPLSDILALDRKAHRSSDDLRRNDITTLHQLRSRNLSDDLTVYLSIIHTCLTYGHRILRRSSKEIATLCFGSKVLHSRKEMTLNAIVCLVKVDSIHLNICINQTLQRVVGGENQLMLVGTTTPVMNLIGFGRAEVMRFTRMNVKHSNASDELQILTGELLGKQNARSNHYNSLRSVSLKLTHSIEDSHVGLTAASGEHTDTLRMLSESI